MKHRIKVLTIPLILLFTLILYGCGSAPVEQSKEKVSKVAMEAVKNQSQSPEKMESNAVQPGKLQEGNTQVPANPKQEQTSEKSTKGPTETKKPAPSSPVPNQNTETKKPVASVTTKPSTANTGTPKPQPKAEPVTTVSLMIKGPKEFGTILSDSKISIKNGEMILTVLLREAKERKFYVEYRGSGATAYVQGLEDNDGKWSFYEFDKGATSGWVFKLNGVSLTQSIGITPIKDGDHIECLYTE